MAAVRDEGGDEEGGSEGATIVANAQTINKRTQLPTLNGPEKKTFPRSDRSTERDLSRSAQSRRQHTTSATAVDEPCQAPSWGPSCSPSESFRRHGACRDGGKPQCKDDDNDYPAALTPVTSSICPWLWPRATGRDDSDVTAQRRSACDPNRTPTMTPTTTAAHSANTRGEKVPYLYHFCDTPSSHSLGRPLCIPLVDERDAFLRRSGDSPDGSCWQFTDNELEAGRSLNAQLRAKMGYHDGTTFRGRKVVTRDKWWHEQMARVPSYCPPMIMSAEDPLFILYLYGLLANDGVTITVFDLTVVYPMPSRYCQTVEKHKLTQCYAPTAIRLLRRLDVHHASRSTPKLALCAHAEVLWGTSECAQGEGAYGMRGGVTRATNGGWVAHHSVVRKGCASGAGVTRELRQQKTMIYDRHALVDGLR
ncbi:hypothetical protein EDB85DRAFT_2171002 [Lactarius pseudohatsudake]|nr:hypothetical protein EDB85DRAFT_2171002 [Lactarius pseudohatsudake]